MAKLVNYAQLAGESGGGLAEAERKQIQAKLEETENLKSLTSSEGRQSGRSDRAGCPAPTTPKGQDF